VRVSTNEKTTGEAVVLEKNLVDNTGTGLPETDIVLGTGSRKEVVNLLVVKVEGENPKNYKSDG
jgi:hypothetical protein